MSKQERSANQGISTWTEVRRRLMRTELDYVVGVVKMLFDSSEDNRRFLTSRIFPETDWSTLLEKYRERIGDAVYPDPPGRIRLGDARKLINEYRKTTSDFPGTVELMVTNLESGTECGRSYGVDYESFYSSLLSMLDDLIDVFTDERNRHLFDRYRDRLHEVAEQSKELGWGYDCVVERLVDAGLLDDDVQAGEPEPVRTTESRLDP